MPNAAPWLDFGTTALYYCGMAEREKYQTPFFFLWIWIGLSAVTQAETLTLSPKQRPEWFTRDGIVMAGSWEPLYFRVRRDGASGYEPTAEQRAAYRQEHSPEMVARLKELGVNFVMMHGNKGGGLEWERESMDDAVRFARLCRDHGLRVGVYVSSATLLWDVFFQEVPAARDWVLLAPDGRPRTYGKAAYRYFWNRNHPDAAAYHRRIVEFAIREIRADLIHCDNYIAGPGRDANSVERFRRYLNDTFTAQERADMGIARLDAVLPPEEPSTGLLAYAWREFSCRSLADSFWDLTRWARTLRSDILMECNPGGPRDRIAPPVDHGRLLQGGEAFWDEGVRPGYSQDRLVTRIPTYKIARRMENAAFTYTRTPLEMAESMAFNRDCLGCICWFEYGKLYDHPGSPALIADNLGPSIRFFRQQRALFRDAEVVADTAVLRSFPSQAFGGPDVAGLTARAEQSLIAARASFQILYDHQLEDLGRYRTLLLAGCVAMSDGQVEQIRRYVRSGGRLCVVGPLATHDAWYRPRRKPALDDLPAAHVVRIAAQDDLMTAVRRSSGHAPSLSVDGPPGVCAELTRQSNRRMVHLVNYRGDEPARGLRAEVALMPGQRARSVVLVSPEQPAARALAFRQKGATVTFTVPEVRVYEIAVVEFQ